MEKKLPKSTKGKTIVINSTHPGAIKNSGIFQQGKKIKDLPNKKNKD